MPRVLLWMPALGALLGLGCASHTAVARDPTTAGTAPCSMTAASPWIEKWLAAWDLTSQRILRLPDAPAPEIVFYDSACVYSTSGVTARGAAPVDGPALRGTRLPWRALAHGGSITLPDSSQVPIQLMSFTNVARETGPFFVMAAPSYWAQMGHGQEPGLTGVFLHEFAHTRQVRGMRDAIGPIDSRLHERNQIAAAFFERESARLAKACQGMAERFLRGGRLLAFRRVLPVGAFCPPRPHPLAPSPSEMERGNESELIEKIARGNIAQACSPSPASLERGPGGEASKGRMLDLPHCGQS